MNAKIVYQTIDGKLWDNAKDNAVSILKTDKLEIGILEISPGVRLPKEGYSIHSENDEFAYILSGEVTFGTDKESIKLEEGMVMYNKRGTPHYTVNLSSKPARILWILSPPR
ncbi:MAG: cupin domain-containing protein [Aigarchaeota archaeon]|nr:cupin domain-containing protein [Candidatus Pelearchaeum maunauluense]